MTRLLAGLWLGIILLAGNVEPTFAQEPPPPFDPNAVTLPSSTSLAGRAVQSFQENCAPCHGPEGNSDGSSSSALPAPPPHLSDPETSLERSPAEYFHIVKYGNIEKRMPPWNSVLTDKEIWDVVFYTWSLHTDQVGIEAGRTLYTSTCARCHGPKGDGDGPDATVGLAGLATAAAVSTQTEFRDSWQQAHPEVGSDWTSAESASVIEAVRTFVYRPPWEPLYMPGSGLISGRVSQGSPDGGVVDDQVVTLRGFVDFSPVATFTTTVDVGGAFTFSALDTDSGIIYFAETEYADVTYDSAVVELSTAAPRQDVELVVYERSNDDSGLRIERGNWVIDFRPGSLVIAQILVLSNDGDTTFAGMEVAGVDMPVTIGLDVPDTADEFRFQDGEIGGQYIRHEDKIFDTAPIRPGSGTRQLFVSYSVPVTAAEATVNQRFPYPLNNLNLLIADLPGLDVAVEGMAYVGEDSLQGAAYKLWNQSDLSALTPIDVRFSGILAPDTDDPRATAPSEEARVAAAPPTATEPPLDKKFAFGFGAIVALLLPALALLGRRRQQNDRPARSMAAVRDELIDQIARLDDAHHNGRISTSVWEEERTDLKAELMAIATTLRAES